MNVWKSLLAVGLLLCTAASLSAQNGPPLSLADRLRSAKFVSLEETSGANGNALVRMLHVYSEVEWKKRMAACEEYVAAWNEYTAKEQAARAKMDEASKKWNETGRKDEALRVKLHAAFEEHDQVKPPADPFRRQVHYEVVTVGADFIELRSPDNDKSETLLMQLVRIDKVYWHREPAKE
jgi:hypothetical protein